MKKMKKKAITRTAFLNFDLGWNGLHIHTYYANTDLFKNFIEKFIEKTVELESNSKDDFIEERG